MLTYWGQTKVKPKQLCFAELSEELQPYWLMFLKLSSRRNFIDGFPRKILFTEIKAFCELSNIKLEAWLLDALLKLDDAYVEAWITNGG